MSRAAGGRPAFLFSAPGRAHAESRARRAAFDPDQHPLEIRVVVQTTVLVALHCDGLANSAAKANTVGLTTYGAAAVNKKQ